MPNERVSNLIGELFQLIAKYSAKEFEIAAQIIVHEKTTKQVESLALTLAEIKKAIDYHHKMSKRRVATHQKTPELLKYEANVDNFAHLLRKNTDDKKRFDTTKSVRLFLEQLFGAPVGKTKDGRERIISKAIKLFEESLPGKRVELYKRLQELSSLISSDFEGYYNIIRRNTHAYPSQ